MHQSFCCFTLNQGENKEKGKDELLMTYLGYRKATRHLLDDKFLYMESLLCLHCPSEGKENKQRIEPGSCHKSQEVKWSPGKGKSQHAKSLTTLTDS